MKPTLKMFLEVVFWSRRVPGDDIGGTSHDALQFHRVAQRGKATSMGAPVPVEIISDKKSTHA